MTNLPLQPLVLVDRVLRFEKNPIVEHLLDNGNMDMNYLAIWCHENNIENKYQEQFAQLIGYSVSGFSSLSYVSDETMNRVDEYYFKLENENDNKI